MSADTLLPYYKAQLQALRVDGAAFATRHPEVAASLELRPDGCADPHVERLIEAVAYLSARIERRLDDGVSELATAMIQGKAPHLLAPIPSMAIAHLALDPSQGKASKGALIPRHTPLYTASHQGHRCRFRSAWDLHLWPLNLRGITVETGSPPPGLPDWATSRLRLDFEMFPGCQAGDMGIDHLDLYIPGEGPQGLGLVEYLLKDVRAVVVEWEGGGGRCVPKGRERLTRARALGAGERLLPYGKGEGGGDGILWEYFTFPRALRCIQLSGVEAISGCNNSKFSISFLGSAPLGTWASGVHAESIKLGCVPIVNLFERVAEPLRLNHRHVESAIVPDRFQGAHMELHSVLGVEGYVRGQENPRVYRPALGPEVESASGPDLRFSTRREATLSPSGSPSRVYLEVGDLSLTPAPPLDEELRINLLCTNHDRPSQLPSGEGWDRLMVESIPLKEARCLTKPTPSIRPPAIEGDLWDWVSTMGGGTLTLGSPEEGALSLKALLRGKDALGSPGNQHLIGLIQGLSARPMAVRLRGGQGQGAHVRGLELEITLHPEAIDTPGIYLFGSVLERFFGSRAPVNSCTALSIRIPGEPELCHQWPPRAGEQVIL